MKQPKLHAPLHDIKANYFQWGLLSRVSMFTSKLVLNVNDIIFI